MKKSINGLAFAVAYRVLTEAADKLMTLAFNKKAKPLYIPYKIEKGYSKSQKLKIQKMYRKQYVGKKLMTQKGFANKINKTFKTNKSVSTIIRIAKG